MWWWLVFLIFSLSSSLNFLIYLAWDELVIFTFPHILYWNKYYTKKLSTHHQNSISRRDLPKRFESRRQLMCFPWCLCLDGAAPCDSHVYRHATPPHSYVTHSITLCVCVCVCMCGFTATKLHHPSPPIQFLYKFPFSVRYLWCNL